MNSLLLVLVFFWLCLEVFWLPVLHARLDSTIRERIKMSDVIASMNLNEKKFPHVATYIQNNFALKNVSDAIIQAEFTALISTAARENRVTLKSLKYQGNSENGRVKELVSSLEISGSLMAIQNFLSVIENDTRIIRVEDMELTTGDKVKVLLPSPALEYQVKTRLHLGKIKFL